MRRITGLWYAPLSSKRLDAELLVSTTGKFRLIVNKQILLQGQFNDLEISHRTGNIPRRITFMDTSLLESSDNDIIDDVLTSSSHKAAQVGMLHRLESSWRWVATALVVILVVTFSFFKWGLPATAGYIAHGLPVSVHEKVAAGSMQLLDQFFFKDSKLSTAEQNRINKRFEKYISQIDQQDFTFRLYFRDMGGLPNAMALPSGEIIVTDGLARLADPPEELDAVLMHEIGHVLERHGMQHVIEASTIALITSLIIGDVSGAGELIAGVPTFLLQSNYSRKSETAADNFAFGELTAQRIDPVHFANIIMKLENSTKELMRKKSSRDNGEVRQPSDEDSAKNTDYLSSHPNSLERAKKARRYSAEHFPH